MKKNLIGILASLGCLACLAGCGGDKTDGLTSAKDYVKDLYKNAATETGADFEREGKVTINGVAYTIVWSVNVNEGVVVTQTEAGNYLIDIDENAEANIDYVLTATIKDANGKTETLTYNHTVPKFRELTWAEFTATEDEKSVVIKGIISGIVDNDDKNKHELYLQDNDGGYYVYNLAAEKMDGLAIGQEIRVRGTRDSYYGVNQIINADVEILNETPVAVTPLDITELYTSAETLQDEALTAKQSMLVVIKGATVLGQDAGDPTYFNFKLGDLKSYVRLSTSACMFGEEDQTAFKNAVKDNKGKAADVTGVVSIYNNKIYIIPTTKDAFSNFQLLNLTAAEKIDFEADLMLGFAAKVSKTQDLQVKGSVYEDVAIAWTSNNETVAKVEGGKLVITRPASEAADVTVKVTATITCGDAEAKTVDFEFVVPKEPATLPLAISEAPVVGEKYKFYVEQGNLDKTLYFTGSMDDSGKYLVSTDVQEEAVDVEVKAVEGEEGKFYLYCEGFGYFTVNVTEKDGKYSFSLSSSRKVDSATKFVWDEANKTLVTDAEDSKQKAYIGTYNSFETFSASAYSYISTSFPARLCKLVDKSQIPAEPEKPETPELTDPKDIVDAAYALAKDAVLGKYTLTGIIISVNDVYSTQYKNVTVTIAIAGRADKPMKCYRMKGTGADTIKVGDVITVSGTIKNYNGTVEFDSGCTVDAVKTAAETVDAAYALAKDTAMEGTQMLTGVITAVNDAYSTQYKNVTVTMQVGDKADKLIMCYRMKGTGADTIKVGDTITVSGKIKNYNGTVEFDSGCILESYTAAPEEGDTANVLATFTFGANGAAEHVENNTALSEDTTYTDGNYSLTLTGMSKVYDKCYDAKGNSCIKLGTSKVVGTFSFTVADDVDKVIIKVAQYKANTTKIKVNGVDYTITTASNNGEYTEIVIDTTTTKTVTFETVSGGMRAMIDSIAYAKKN